MRISKLVAVVAVAVMVSACTTTGETGNPTAAPPPSNSSSNGSGDEMPARPASIKLDAVDTCKLLTVDQMKQIGAPVARPEQLSLVKGQQSPSCDYSGDGGFGYQVGAVTHKGVSHWLQGGGNIDAKVIKVADYGAVEVKLKVGRVSTALWQSTWPMVSS